MAELQTGDRVQSLRPIGSEVPRGSKGLVVGHQGQEVIVSWGLHPPYIVETVPRSALALVARPVSRSNQRTRV